MKKLALSIFLILVSIFVFGQRFNGGAMIGFAASQVAGDTYSGFNKAGPLGGFFVNYESGGRSGLQMELYYIQKGSRKTADYEQGDYDSYLLRLNYIELPLLYQYQIKWFTLEAGPSLGFFMSKKEEIDEVTEEVDNFASLTFQINFGVVFTIATNWKLGIRTNNSLTNLRNETHTGYVYRFGTYGQFNDVIQFTMAYQFMHWGK